MGKLILLIEELYNSDVVSKTLLIAGTSPSGHYAPSEVVYAYITPEFLFFTGGLVHIGVKITTTRGQPAEVRSKYTCSEASQRLLAGDLSYAYLVGLIEGDG